MRPLYEIDSQIQRLIELDDDRLVDPETGEIILAKELEAIELEREQKIENCLLCYLNLKAEEEMLKNEEKKFTDRAAYVARKAERLRLYVQDSLKGEAFQTLKVGVKYTRSKSVQVDEIDMLDPRFLRTKVEPDKTAITKALKNDEEVIGARFIEKVNMLVK